MLCTFEHKLLLLERAGLDLMVTQPFTLEFAQKSFADFLKELHARFPFSYLIQGEGTTFGKEKMGDNQRVSELGEKIGFKAEYLKKTVVNGEIVSSGAIRKCIQQKDLAKVEALLGRPYSIYARYQKRGIPLEGLCHLPAGIYPVSVKNYSGTAALNSHLTLNLPGCREDLEGQLLEIIFTC